MKNKLVLGKDYDGWCFRYHGGMWCTGSFLRTKKECWEQQNPSGSEKRKAEINGLGKLIRVKLVEVI